jgi:hypothetical protein
MSKMGTDEDIVAQVIAMTSNDNRDLIEITNDVDLPKYDKHWEKGLEQMGNCSFVGTIPPEAITRYVVIDWETCANWIWLKAADTSVSIVNHTFLQEDHKNFTAWLLGDEDLTSQFEKLDPRIKKELKKQNKQKTGINVFLP